ncbi:GNAT family N-acetyltransferase [Haloferacaceae archaeon DSL9]
MDSQSPRHAAYEFRDDPPTVDDFLRLREAAGMAARSREAVARGLPNTTFGVTVYRDDVAVGMGRIVGDGGSVYQIADMAVDPDHQGAGLGTAIMDRLMAYLEANAPSGAYVNLIADVEGFYERWGFEEVRPASRGMYLRTA